jgi:hypothetical protein
MNEKKLKQERVLGEQQEKERNSVIENAKKRLIALFTAIGI